MTWQKAQIQMDKEAMKFAREITDARGVKQELIIIKKINLCMATLLMALSEDFSQIFKPENRDKLEFFQCFNRTFAYDENHEELVRAYHKIKSSVRGIILD